MLLALVPMIGVQDVNASVDFYCDKLGFVLDDEFVHDGVRRWAHLQRDQAALMLTSHNVSKEPHTRDGHRDVALYCYTTDLTGLLADLREAGCAVKGPWVTFYGQKEIQVEDPDGYRVLIGQQTEEPQTIEQYD